MRAIFLDRDGVINENRADHVKSWSEFRFVPGSLTAIKHLHQAGFKVFVVTNQAIVERGLASAQTVEDIHRRMIAQVALHGGAIHDVSYCPHDTTTYCGCRKPAPGMLLELARRWDVDPSQSYLVGDAWTDIVAGRSVGCQTILVRTGRGAEQMLLPEMRQHPADMVADDLGAAVAWILAREDLVYPFRDNHPPRHSRLVIGGAVPLSADGG